MKLRYIAVLPIIFGLSVMLLIAVPAAIESRPGEAEQQMLFRARDLTSSLEVSSIVSTEAFNDFEYYPEEDQNDLCPVLNKTTDERLSELMGCSVRRLSVEELRRGESDAFAQTAFSALESGQKEKYEISEEGNTRMFRYAAPLRMEAECMSCHAQIAEVNPDALAEGDLIGVVSVSFETQEYDSAARSFIAFDLLVTLLLFVISFFSIMIPLRRFAVKPLEEIEEVAEQIALGDFDKRIKIRKNMAVKEISTLARQFNNMVENVQARHNAIEEEVHARTRELETANEQLKESQRVMEELNHRLQEESEYKSEFLSIVSHELKTPLTSILANVDTLKADDVSGDHLAIYSDMEKSAAVLNRNISNLLDVAKLDEKRMELVYDVVDILDVIATVETIIMPISRKKGVEITTEVQDTIPILLLDSDKLMKIVINLMTNGIRFTEAGGHVVLKVSYTEQEKLLVVTVSDDGVGLKPDEVELVFERFYQSDHTIARSLGGTGLGLSLVKELAVLHGGDAWAVPLEKGTEFFATIRCEPWGDES